MEVVVDILLGLKHLPRTELWCDREVRFDCSGKELTLRAGEELLELIVSMPWQKLQACLRFCTSNLSASCCISKLLSATPFGLSHSCSSQDNVEDSKGNNGMAGELRGTLLSLRFHGWNQPVLVSL